MGSGRYRSEHEAVQAFRGTLNLIASCITHDTIQYEQDSEQPHRGMMSFHRTEAVRLSGTHRLWFRIWHHVEATRQQSRWSLSTRAYLYHVLADDREILAFHWHPSRSESGKPHAHYRTLIHPVPMGKVHFPSGRVSLEAVVRLLIEELGTIPARRDWSAVLARTEAQFEQDRSWH